jgi:hypothetical protein
VINELLWAFGMSNFEIHSPMEATRKGQNTCGHWKQMNGISGMRVMQDTKIYTSYGTSGLPAYEQ